MKLFMIFLFSVASLNLVTSHNCKFDFTHFDDYSCGINLNSANKDEMHQNGKTDDDVERLKIQGSNSTHLSQSDLNPACQRFRNLRNIEVYLVKSVDDNLFQQCKQIDRIWIEFFEMDEIPENLFSSQPDLILIELRKGSLRILPENLFQNQKKLEELRTTYNQIASLSSNIFANLQSLTLLDLANNKIKELPINVFDNLRNLKWLHLNDNQLSIIHSDSFGICLNINLINLKNNKINEIDEKLIDSLNVKKINMRGNICSDEEAKGDKNQIKAKLSNCFNNNQPRMTFGNSKTKFLILRGRSVVM